MIAALDHLLTVMIEMPIDALQFAGAFVLNGQGIINGQVDGQRRIGNACREITKDEFAHG